MGEIVIRRVKKEDLDKIAEIEVECFPAAEAASKQSIEERIATFPESFLVAEKNREIVGFINGCATNSPVIYDALYHDSSHHIPDGESLAVFGLDVLPEHQRQGIAAKLMNYYIEIARNDGRKRVILTCKDRLVHYYEYFGFVNNGISESTYGGAQWFNMTLTI
jgi:ribosomal protein S18 acetylase RimI-like enzyme